MGSSPSILSREEAFEIHRKYEETKQREEETRRSEDWQRSITWVEKFNCNKLVTKVNEEILKNPTQFEYTIDIDPPSRLELECLKYKLALKGRKLVTSELDSDMYDFWCRLVIQ